MSAPSLRDLLVLGLDVLSTKLDEATNAIVAVLGDSVAQGSDGSEAEWVQHSGFASVPAPATAGSSSCQTVAIRQGSRNVVVASRDNRACDRYANLRPGECCLFATVGQARVVCKRDGSVTLYTTDDNTPSGKAVYFRLHPTDGFVFNAPWGSFFFDQLGWRVRHAGGFNLRAGGIGGLPGPLSSIGSYFNVTAGMQKFQGSLVMLGNGPAYNPAAFALAENPLTTPGNGVGVTAVGFGAPIGVYTSTSVRISGTPATG